jgi:acetyltransferase-like isoleucine patch superfamily enzyme
VSSAGSSGVRAEHGGLDGEQAEVHPTTILFGPVRLGGGTVVGPFCLLAEGYRPQTGESGALRIGAGATIRSHSVLYWGSVIGDRFHAGHGVLVREEVEVEDDVSIGSHSVVEHHVMIGPGVRLHSNVFVPEYTRLDAGCWIGPNVVMTNARYPRSRGVKDSLRGPTIEAGAKVGANATLLPGITIGADALVGAGAVVTKDVAARDVMVGNPARVIGRLDDIEDYTQVLTKQAIR